MEEFVCRICGGEFSDDYPAEWVDVSQNADAEGFYLHGEPRRCHEALEHDPDGDYILLDGERARLLPPEEWPESPADDE